ncbi:hypothetical protein V8E53_008565 [Lactarius tabidus]
MSPAQVYPCPHHGCSRVLRNKSGLTQHRHARHGFSLPPPRQCSSTPPSQPQQRSPTPASQPQQRSPTPPDRDPHPAEADNGEPLVDYHLELDSESAFTHPSLFTDYFTFQGRHFDEEGLHKYDEPPVREPDDWYPYSDRIHFETADLFYHQIQLSASHIDPILQLWSATVNDSPTPLPFEKHKDLYKTIDQTLLGDIPWSSFTLKYNGVRPTEGDIPQWMDATFQICYRDPRVVIHSMLGHPGFKDHMDYDEIAKDPSTHGSTFVPVILGSDKTVISVGTGHTEYWPLYLSTGNVCNHLHRAHKGAVAVIGFLSIPKTKKKDVSSLEFRKFKQKLFHASLTKILSSLRPAMTAPELMRFGDGHYRRIVYGLGPYIADYEEQVLLSCIVRGWCRKCTAFPDALDTGGLLRSREHLEVLFEETTPGIMWDQFGAVGDVLPFSHHFPRGDIYELLAPDLLHQLIKGTFKDHLVEISVVPPFSHLCCFPQGRGFEQWTGDDSKALMKVYLPAIEGHVPRDVYRSVFKDTGVRTDISLPWQHSMMHYSMLIRLFGAPNGLCSSITESKHIDDVKDPWQWSNRFNALLQMLLGASRADFQSHGNDDTHAQAQPPTLTNVPPGIESDVRLGSIPKQQHACNIGALSQELSIPELPQLVNNFLCEQRDGDSIHDSPNHTCPRFSGRVNVVNRAIATFHAPSDPSNTEGMQQEVIRATSSWFKGMPQYDCIFVNTSNEVNMICFFSFVYLGITYPCALVHWFSHISEEWDEDSGMWMVSPDFDRNKNPNLAVIHIDCIFRTAHLVPIFGDSFVPDNITNYNSLDSFKGFYVNCFVDHHAFHIAS